MDVLSLWAGVLSYGSKQYPEVHLHVITQILLLLNQFMKKVRLQTNTLTLSGTFSIKKFKDLVYNCENYTIQLCFANFLPVERQTHALQFPRRGVFPTEGA